MSKAFLPGSSRDGRQNRDDQKNDSYRGLEVTFVQYFHKHDRFPILCRLVVLRQIGDLA